MRKPLPDKIQNAPELFFGLELYYFSYWELSSDRYIGFSPGPIPWAARQGYAEKHGFSDEQTEDLHYFVIAMDKTYLEYLDEKMKAKQKHG